MLVASTIGHLKEITEIWGKFCCALLVYLVHWLNFFCERLEPTLHIEKIANLPAKYVDDFKFLVTLHPEELRWGAATWSVIIDPNYGVCWVLTTS